jgi:hypothetical protein
MRKFSHMNNQIVQLKMAVGALGLSLLLYEPIKLGLKKFFTKETEAVEHQVLHRAVPVQRVPVGYV